MIEKKSIICIQCNRAGHIRPGFQYLKRKGSGGKVGHLDVDMSSEECFTPYFKKLEIDGLEQNSLPDTWAGIDLCDRKWVDNEDLIA